MLDTAFQIPRPRSRPVHPAPDELHRFMRGALPGPEVRAVVRHLLTGCAECLQVTRRLWSLADRAPLDPENPE
jgi:hypothetical protein